MKYKELLTSPEHLASSTFRDIAESDDFTLKQKDTLFKKRAEIGDNEGKECQRFIDETGMVNLTRE